MVATDDYKGYMIFGFENGKVAKIVLESYATKTNRRSLPMHITVCQGWFISDIFWRMKNWLPLAV